MISRIHSRLGTTGFIVAVVALVAALGGGAVAAGGGLSGPEKQQIKKESKKWSKKFSQQFAVPGAPGAAGAQGPKGDTGAQGPKGDKGDTGAQGPKGDKGATGAEGPEGSPWTAGGLLPEGKTETGVWGYGGEGAGLATISFNLPLAEAPTNLRLLGEGEGETTECPGTLENPEAAAGELCVYTDEAVAALPGESKLYTSGAKINFVGFSGESEIFGTWAVTAHVAP